MNPMTAWAIVDGRQESSEDERLEAWQYLVTSGMINTMPGSYGRMAQNLIDEGLICVEN